ncbi:multipass membrane protein [Oleiphilus messinensis]|uniref:Multipass membrane protein n=1 Tax=Oleiphilus messinensis TaxID=141451 RepID=A0A1Y0I156_9GAMM|nr:DUF4166 domain-containing protein [Oleiphilus messinensis]ARU54131.1 multipass membrane protein [Oleiphilus messinensis]
MNIFTTHIGEEFHELSPLLQKVHTGHSRMEGCIAVKRGGKLANIICNIFGFPRHNLQTDLAVECDHNAESMVWVRYFDGLKMSSRFISGNNCLVEKLGPLSMRFKTRVNEGALEYHFLGTRLFGIPMPAFLCPQIKAREQEKNGYYSFNVSVSMFLIGFVLSYGGELSVK